MRIAHEAIYDLQAELVASGAREERSSELLAESARIALAEVPALTAEARSLAHLWHEQSVLDPLAAERTLWQLAIELERVEAQLRRQLDRQRDIARRLQELVDRPG